MNEATMTVVARVHRVEGQRGEVSRMIGAHRSSIDLFLQLASAPAALGNGQALAKELGSARKGKMAVDGRELKQTADPARADRGEKSSIEEARTLVVPRHPRRVRQGAWEQPAKAGQSTP